MNFFVISWISSAVFSLWAPFYWLSSGVGDVEGRFPYAPKFHRSMDFFLGICMLYSMLIAPVISCVILG